MTSTGRWQLVLLDALAQAELVGVTAAVDQHLGRRATRVELTAARRTAARLARDGWLTLHQVRVHPDGRRVEDCSWWSPDPTPPWRACVCDLVEPVGLSQPTVSHHMSQLVDAGLITREQRGKWAYYRLVDGALTAVAGALSPSG